MSRKTVQLSRAGQPASYQDQISPTLFHPRYPNLSNSSPQQSNFPSPSPIFSNNLGSQQHYPPQPVPECASTMQASTYPSPYSNPNGFQTQHQLPPFAPEIGRHNTQHPPQVSTQSQPQLSPVDHYPLTPATPSNASPFLRTPSRLSSSISTPASQSTLQALPQSQCLEATGNLYPHMRTTTLRFLLGDKYVEEEKGEGWSTKGLLNNDKANGKSMDRRGMSINSTKERIIPGKGLVIDLVSDDEDTLQKETPLEEALIIEKKRTAALLQELEAAKAEINTLTNNYQNEWNQVETLQKQMREIQEKAISAQNTLPEFMPRIYSADEGSKTDRSYNEILRKQLIDGRKGTKRLKELLNHPSRFQSSSGTPISQPNKISQTPFMGVSEELKKVLKNEELRSQWFKKQLADPEMIYTELDTRASSTNAVKDTAKALEVERRLREVAERTLTHERVLTGEGEEAPLARKVLAELREERKVLEEVGEELLNGRTQSRSVADVSSSAKKRRLNPTLEELGLERKSLKFEGGKCGQCFKDIKSQDADGPCRYHPGSKTLRSRALPRLVEQHGERCYKGKSVDEMLAIYGASHWLSDWSWSCCERSAGGVGCCRVPTHTDHYARRVPH
ncbi:uncharacterized protein EAE97_005994 [Botrytis byssoidea]|uniref:Uncharacterized protein n=1 Tax=Botrytis byssoidea TaxID=139641 RepID=A0A9P5IRB5_9HELO|nr:uncharacterized protein EAE97_005994 [Botrytis byssoidea]KAF7943924.1 hypothetical protein EAE97_005994 [Botrytis byssoidea]